MRSVLVSIGGTIRHLRYSIAAVEDLDQILPDGFLSVFDLEADLQTCHLLLWAGLRHDGTGYERAGEIMIDEGAAYNPIVLLGFWKKITEALVNDDWINIDRKDSPNAPRPLREIIAEMERIAVAEMNMKPEDLYGLTPREFSLIRENYGLRENKRAGIICTTMANIHARGKNDPAFTPENFIRTGERAKEQTAEEQKAALMGALI